MTVMKAFCHPAKQTNYISVRNIHSFVIAGIHRSF